MATVLVTHDPEEAALLADEVVVIADGQALQVGDKTSVFAFPNSPEVARLLAIDNLQRGRISTPGKLISAQSELRVADSALAPGTEVSWCIRAEQVLLHRQGDCGSEGSIASLGPDLAESHCAVVLEVCDLGAWREVTVCLAGGLTLTARSPATTWLTPGQRCWVTLAPEHVSVWKAAEDRVCARV